MVTMAVCNRNVVVMLLGLCLTTVACDRQAAHSSSRATLTTELRVAAASDLQFALEEVKEQFQLHSPDVKLEVVYGASGKLYTQITQGAPFDVFLSADQQLIQNLIDEKLALGDSEFLYARGHIVMWALKSRNLQISERGLNVLRDEAVQKIAIANPQHAPYGRAAEAALKSLSLYEDVQPRLVLGENIAQTMQFVESGAADVGFIGLALARSPQLLEKGEFWQVPDDAYPPLQQSGAILVQAGQKEVAARKFCEFLQTADGQSILQQFGFAPPGN